MQAQRVKDNQETVRSVEPEKPDITPKSINQETINNNQIDKIPSEIDLNDRMKTTLAISSSLKRYLDKNKKENETFTDELIRLIFNK